MLNQCVRLGFSIVIALTGAGAGAATTADVGVEASTGSRIWV